jgi:hypothetical protein
MGCGVLLLKLGIPHPEQIKASSETPSGISQQQMSWVMPFFKLQSGMLLILQKRKSVNAGLPADYLCGEEAGDVSLSISMVTQNPKCWAMHTAMGPRTHIPPVAHVA